MELIETRPLLLTKPPLVRRPGLHVSDIIRSLMEALDGKVGSSQEVIPDDVKAKFEAGYAAEAAFEAGFRETATHEDLGERIGEIEYEGVWGSPDGVARLYSLGDPDLLQELCLDEVKCSWMSPKKHKPHEIMRWRMQVLAYCKMLQETYHVPCHTVRWWCYWVNGMYEYPLKPVPIRYTYVVSDQEICENWLMLMNHRRNMEANSAKA
jgi:hypothetical protein